MLDFLSSVMHNIGKVFIALIVWIWATILVIGFGIILVLSFLINCCLGYNKINIKINKDIE